MLYRKQKNKEIQIKCILILSDRSSGSSALQRALAKHPELRHIDKTRHHYSETLYWNKAVAMLGQPQPEIAYGEFPMSAGKAEGDLRRLLSDNVPDYQQPDGQEELIFGGWEALCQNYAPAYLEKSPFHIHSWPALQLIKACEERCPHISFRYIGLIRNPIDTFYSMWKRWSAVPEVVQDQWKHAYQNLLSFAAQMADRATIIRYEDLTSDRTVLDRLCNFLGISRAPGMGEDFHAQSVQKWRHDRLFGFCPNEQVVQLARQYGYTATELQTKRRLIWPFWRAVNFNNYRIVDQTRRVKYRIRHAWSTNK